MTGEGCVVPIERYSQRMPFANHSRSTVPLRNPLSFLVLGVGVLGIPSSAHALECWEVTGWTTTPMPGTQSPGNSYERAILASTGCSTSPHDHLWVQVDQAMGGATAPSDLHVLVDRFDTTRVYPGSLAPPGSAPTLNGGLVYQGSVLGVIPDLWRATTNGIDDPLERHSPSPAPPTDGAAVMLEHFQGAECLYYAPDGNGPLEFFWSHCAAASPFFGSDLLGTGTPGWDPGNWWASGLAFELLYEGTNTAGEDEWSIADLGQGKCLATFPGTANMGVAQCNGTPERTWVFEDSVIGGNVQIRHVDTGLCLGPSNGLSRPRPTLVTCGSAQTDYVMTTLELGTAPPGDGGPAEDDPSLPPGLSE